MCRHLQVRKWKIKMNHEAIREYQAAVVVVASALISQPASNLDFRYCIIFVVAENQLVMTKCPRDLKVYFLSCCLINTTASDTHLLRDGFYVYIASDSFCTLFPSKKKQLDFPRFFWNHKHHHQRNFLFSRAETKF